MKRLKKAMVISTMATLPFFSFKAQADMYPKGVDLGTASAVQLANSEVLGSFEISDRRKYLKVSPGNQLFTIIFKGPISVIKKPRLVERNNSKMLVADFKIQDLFPTIITSKRLVLIGDEVYNYILGVAYEKIDRDFNFREEVMHRWLNPQWNTNVYIGDEYIYFLVNEQEKGYIYSVVNRDTGDAYNIYFAARKVVLKGDGSIYAEVNDKVTLTLSGRAINIKVKEEGSLGLEEIKSLTFQIN